MMDALRSEFAQVQQVVEDEEQKKALVLKLVQSKLMNESSSSSSSSSSSWMEFEDVQRIFQTLRDGDGSSSLEAELVAGGKTNYSFRIYVKDGKESNGKSTPTASIYTKLYLKYAVWDADHKLEFDIQRAVSEFETMQKLNDSSDASSESPVATPYCVLDVEAGAGAGAGENGKEEAEPSKLLLAQWATQTEEQWANQFIDGEVDKRVIQKVAKAFAELNLKEVAQDWNDSARKSMLSLVPLVKLHFTRLNLVPEEECDALMNLLREVGQDAFDKVVDKYCFQLNNERQSLCHNDCHPFNIIVEPKRSAYNASLDDEKGEEHDVNMFGPNGAFVICDWETSICGPQGRDAGLFMSFPIACALCLAVQGHKEQALHLTECAQSFWDTYAQTLMENGKSDETDLCRTYRVALGAMGAFQLFHLYMLGLLMDTLPLEGVPGKEADKARAAIGVVGMKLLLLSYDETNPSLASLPSSEETANLDTLEGLKSYYQNLMNNQIDELVLFNHRLKPRRASFLRTLRRRVSDASTVEEATRRLSTQGLDQSYHRRASSYDTSEFGASMCSFVDDDSDMFPVTEEMKLQWAEQT